MIASPPSPLFTVSLAALFVVASVFAAVDDLDDAVGDAASATGAFGCVDGNHDASGLDGAVTHFC